mgnify:CR=1 FL=1
MDKKRKVYAPFSLTSEAGVAQTPVEGYIDVIQTVFPSVNTGTINENGTWTGVKSDDAEFIGLTTHVAVADGGETLSPDTSELNHIDMTGFRNIILAVKPSRGGNYVLQAVMGPDTNRFANLQPVNAGTILQGTADAAGGGGLENLFSETEGLAQDVWNIFTLQYGRLQAQKNMQFKITNSAGGNADIEVAFLRLI